LEDVSEYREEWNDVDRAVHRTIVYLSERDQVSASDLRPAYEVSQSRMAPTLEASLAASLLPLVSLGEISAQRLLVLGRIFPEYWERGIRHILR